MKTASELERIYNEYIAFADTLPRPSILNQFRQSGQPDPSQHPRHQEFYDQAEAWVRGFLLEGPGREAVLPVLELILLSPAQNSKKTAYWYLVAAQRHALILLPELAEADRQALGKAFREAYPVSTQLPLQQELDRAMMGNSEKWWHRLLGK